MEQTNLSPQYDATAIESKWYAKWEEAGLFKPTGNGGKPYTITIPPPNITGSLHMGHSLCYPVQDLLGRFHRLIGDDVHIIPGQDHAGIATQSVVSKQLKAQGISPSAIGREKFVEKTWEWRAESGQAIMDGFRNLGCGFDWSQSRFTLDPDYARAVLKVFIEWYERGLIYRGKRIVNWDPVLQTSVSDIETLREEVAGKLYHIRYPYADGSGYLVIATTRPETMLGDVAVAVHPSDKRYEGKIGSLLNLPLSDRTIPLITDLYPDPEFGTGAVKITPAHDPNDYEVGMRHDLPQRVVLDNNAAVCEPGPYFGLDRYEARERILADLEAAGLLDHIEDHRIAIIKSDRSGAVVEPLLSEQWFAKMGELAEPAINAVKEGNIRFIPDRYNKVYLDWMESIRDWNISRQLWWGHRIPVFYTEDGTPFAAFSWEEAQAKAGDKPIVRQDEDVLDTWFSSGLWPFATQGWPDTEAEAGRYPTSVLVTDRNIIYLWVARMIMMGLDFVKEIPFKDVYIHATVLTQDGKRMSKSLGTGVDPTGVIESIGADSLRMTLLGQAGMNQEIRYSEAKTKDSRNFCNKIWNATRFILMNVGDTIPTKPKELKVEDEWILSRLANCEEITRRAYESYDIQAAAQAIYTFFWSELCDWYIEISKSRMTEPAVHWVLVRCLEASMKLLHPIMPFITEEVTSYLPLADKPEFVMSSKWPSEVSEYRNMASEDQVEAWIEIIRTLRALRAELGLTPRKPLELAYYEGDLGAGEAMILSQSWITKLEQGRPEGQSVSQVAAGVTVYIPSAGLVDLDKLRAELEKVQAEKVKLDSRLGNADFVSRAKPEVVARDKALAEELQARIEVLSQRLNA